MSRVIKVYLIVILFNLSESLCRKDTFKNHVLKKKSSSSDDYNKSHFVKLKMQIDNNAILKCKCMETISNSEDYLMNSKISNKPVTMLLHARDKKPKTDNLIQFESNNRGETLRDTSDLSTENSITTKRKPNMDDYEIYREKDLEALENNLQFNTSTSEDQAFMSDSKLRKRNDSSDDIDNFTSLLDPPTTPSTTTTTTTTTMKTTTYKLKKTSSVDKNSLLDMDTSYSLKSKRIKALKKVKKSCPAFTNGKIMNLDEMPGAWHIIYYQMPDNLNCFKMLIRKTSVEEKKKLMERYGDISDTVDWEKCHLEIKTESRQTKHFLQGESESYGVLRNIIISKNETDGKTVVHEETPDQWRIFGNILIMRDCENGEIAVFMRNTSLPTQNDVIKGLNEYGIEKPNGKVICYVFPDSTSAAGQINRLIPTFKHSPSPTPDIFDRENSEEDEDFTRL